MIKRITLISLGVVGIIILGSYLQNISKGHTISLHKPIISDTVYITDTVYIEKSTQAIDNPIQYSKYHISDRVCAWGRIQCVVTGIRRSANDTNVLVYTIQTIDLNTLEFQDMEFYDTELQAGDCIN